MYSKKFIELKQKYEITGYFTEVIKQLYDVCDEEETTIILEEISRNVDNLNDLFDYILEEFNGEFNC